MPVVVALLDAGSPGVGCRAHHLPEHWFKNDRQLRGWRDGSVVRGLGNALSEGLGFSS